MTRQEKALLCTPLPEATRPGHDRGTQDIQTHRTLRTPNETQRNAAGTFSDENAPAASFWDLPLVEFIPEALRRCAETSWAGWSTLWQFTRMINGYFDPGTDADEAFDAVDAVVQGLGGWAKVFADFEGFEPIEDDEQAYAEFSELWKKIRFRPDEGPLYQAEWKSLGSPLRTSRGKTRRLPGYERFVSFAGWLQVIMGDNPIYLPCRAVAERLHTTKRMVSVWRAWAVEDGILVKTRDHAFRSGAKGRATEFRFDVSRWECLREAAQDGTQAAFDAAEAMST